MQQTPDSPGAQAAELAAAMQSGCLGMRVGRLQRLVARRFDQALRPLGVSLPQLEVLSTLVTAAAPVKPSDLAAWLFVERSTMSRNLALLEQRGLVKTSEVSPTGRMLRVGITAAGIDALAEARGAWGAAQGALRDVVGDDAASILDAWLENLAVHDTVG
jgi:DNA-binding MarR family transcriptional regulator